MTAEMAMYFFGAKCSPEMREGEKAWNGAAGGADDSKIAPSQRTCSLKCEHVMGMAEIGGGGGKGKGHYRLARYRSHV